MTDINQVEVHQRQIENLIKQGLSREEATEAVGARRLTDAHQRKIAGLQLLGMMRRSHDASRDADPLTQHEIDVRNAELELRHREIEAADELAVAERNMRRGFRPGQQITEPLNALAYLDIMKIGNEAV